MTTAHGNAANTFKKGDRVRRIGRADEGLGTVYVPHPDSDGDIAVTWDDEYSWVPEGTLELAPSARIAGVTVQNLTISQNGEPSFDHLHTALLDAAEFFEVDRAVMESTITYALGLTTARAILTSHKEARA